MRQLTHKEKLQLREELRVSQIKVLLEWDFNSEEIAKTLNLPITEVKIYITKYKLDDGLLRSLREVNDEENDDEHE